MEQTLKYALIALGLAIAAGLIAFGLALRADTRSGEFARRGRALNAALAALDAIEAAAELYPEIENPLASRVKQLVRDHRQDQRKKTQA